MEASDLRHRIERLLAPSIEALGYEIVRVQLSGGRVPTLQVMAERTDGMPMGADDCATISRTASALLDVEDPLVGSYTLEVSSPGIDRPLVRPRDFERYAGFEAKVETATPIEGRRRFRGKLLGLEGETVRLAMPEGTVALPAHSILKASLVLTDELLAAAGNRARAAKEGRR